MASWAQIFNIKTRPQLLLLSLENELLLCTSVSHSDAFLGHPLLDLDFFNFMYCHLTLLLVLLLFLVRTFGNVFDESDLHRNGNFWAGTYHFQQLFVGGGFQKFRLELLEERSLMEDCDGARRKGRDNIFSTASFAWFFWSMGITSVFYTPK